MVTEQVLNLNGEEIMRLEGLLQQNLQSENRIYRYNYFYNNCTTKARDIIEQCVNGEVKYAEREDFTPSYRDMVHEMTRNKRWAQWGNDLLLGIKADQPTTLRQQEFLPHNLMYDFDRAQIYENGIYRPLVKERRIAVPAGVQIIKKEFPVTPIQYFCMMLVIGIIFFIMEWRKKGIYIYWDALLMLLQGLAGCVLFAMLFSEHPTTSTNLQILLLNPLPLFFIPAVLKRKRSTYWWTILLVMIILFFIGRCFQVYAEGMIILALCLLIRYWSHYKNA